MTSWRRELTGLTQIRNAPHPFSLELINQSPEHIDAYDHLALTLETLGGPRRPFRFVEDGG